MNKDHHQALKLHCVKNKVSMQDFIHQLTKNSLESKGDTLKCGN